MLNILIKPALRQARANDASTGTRERPLCSHPGSEIMSRPTRDPKALDMGDAEHSFRAFGSLPANMNVTKIGLFM